MASDPEGGRRSMALEDFHAESHYTGRPAYAQGVRQRRFASARRCWPGHAASSAEVWTLTISLKETKQVASNKVDEDSARAMLCSFVSAWLSEVYAEQPLNPPRLFLFLALG